MNLSAPRLKTIKRLFAVSGNQCYFPNCSTPLIDKSSGTVTGEICHIKGIKPESPRYDPNQSDEERHSFDNLLLMCPIHHKVIDDDPDSYTASRLIDIKMKHEELNAGGEEPSDEIVRQFILNLTQGSVIYSKDQKGGQIAHSIINIGYQSVNENKNTKNDNRDIEYSIDLETAQLFFNKFCILIKKIYQKKISYNQLSKILMHLQRSTVKRIFGIRIIHNQDNKSYNLEILEKRYSLKIISNDSKIDITLKKNKKPIDFDNFSNISKMIIKLKEFALMKYGLEVKIPNYIPAVKIKATSSVYFIGDMKISSTKSLTILVSNQNEFPIEIISSGFKANNTFFKKDEHQILRLEPNSSDEISIFFVLIKIALKKNYKKPHIIQGFIKLNSGEYFLTKKLKMPNRI